MKESIKTTNIAFFLFNDPNMLTYPIIFITIIILCCSETALSEPGYYEDGNFGIRLENVLIIKKADTKFNFGDKGYLQFEHITWVSHDCYAM